MCLRVARRPVWIGPISQNCICSPCLHKIQMNPTPLLDPATLSAVWNQFRPSTHCTASKHCAGPIHTGEHTNVQAIRLMLLVSNVNTPIRNSRFLLCLHIALYCIPSSVEENLRSVHCFLFVDLSQRVDSVKEESGFMCFACLSGPHSCFMQGEVVNKGASQELCTCRPILSAEDPPNQGFPTPDPSESQITPPLDMS